LRPPPAPLAGGPNPMSTAAAMPGDADVAFARELQRQLVESHEEYLARHPELMTMLNNFVDAVLESQPADIRDFASQFFRGSPIASSLEGALGGTSSTLGPLIISGPSGTGKGTLISLLQERYPGRFGFSVSHTTRGPRPGEQDGVHYYFTDHEDMERRIANGEFIEHAHVHTNIYGTSFAAVDAVRAQGRICILDIDVQGVQRVKAAGLDPAPRLVFVAPPSIEQLEERLRNRGTETEEKIRVRIGNASAEMEYGFGEGNFDKVVVNDDLETAFQELVDALSQWYPLGAPAPAASDAPARA